jgi:hypothetical protein
MDNQFWNAGGILLGWVMLVAPPIAALGIAVAFLALLYWAHAVTTSYPDYAYADALIVVSCIAGLALMIAGVVALFVAKGMP